MEREGHLVLGCGLRDTEEADCQENECCEGSTKCQFTPGGHVPLESAIVMGNAVLLPYVFDLDQVGRQSSLCSLLLQVLRSLGDLLGSSSDSCLIASLLSCLEALLLALELLSNHLSLCSLLGSSSGRGSCLSNLRLCSCLGRLECLLLGDGASLLLGSTSSSDCLGVASSLRRERK